MRDRPHDVPDQDKLLWWIPIVLVTEDKMNFTNTTPIAWMKKEREIVLQNMPKKDQFIIVNPEEIGTLLIYKILLFTLLLCKQTPDFHKFLVCVYRN